MSIGTLTTDNGTVRARPDRRYVVASGGTGYAADGGIVLSRAADEIQRQYGADVYDLMQEDAQVKACLEVRKRGILAKGPRVTPVITLGRSHRPSDEPGIDPAERTERAQAEADAELAAEIAAECQRSLDRLARPFRETLREMLDAMAVGCQVAEVTMEIAPDGPDAGELVLAEIAPLDRRSWAFVVDRYRRVTALWATTDSGPRRIDRSKFAVLSWRPKAGDPRGTSELKAAYNPWNSKLQADPMRLRYLMRFGEPSLALELGPNPLPAYPLGIDGLPDTTQPQIPAATAAAQECERFTSGGRYLIVPNGGSASIIEAQGTGEAFHSAEEDWDRQIAKAILGPSRAIDESQYGSRADSESAVGLVMLGFQEDGQTLANTVVDEIFYPVVLARHGKEIADRFTPNVEFPVDSESSAPLMTAVAGVLKVLPPAPAQAVETLEWLGLPTPTPAEMQEQMDAKRAADEARAAAFEGQRGQDDSEDDDEDEDEDNEEMADG